MNNFFVLLQKWIQNNKGKFVLIVVVWSLFLIDSGEWKEPIDPPYSVQEKMIYSEWGWGGLAYFRRLYNE